MGKKYMYVVRVLILNIAIINVVHTLDNMEIAYIGEEGVNYYKDKFWKGIDEENVGPGYNIDKTHGPTPFNQRFSKYKDVGEEVDEYRDGRLGTDFISLIRCHSKVEKVIDIAHKTELASFLHLYRVALAPAYTDAFYDITPYSYKFDREKAKEEALPCDRRFMLLVKGTKLEKFTFKGRYHVWHYGLSDFLDEKDNMRNIIEQINENIKTLENSRNFNISPKNIQEKDAN